MIRQLLLLFSFIILSITIAAGQAPVNDDPCNATPLTAGTNCTYTNSTNLNATGSAGVPAPGCANYSGGDVWFSVVVPNSGSIIFDSNTGGVTDGGMALYTGTCNALTLVTCDDDGSSNGFMPSISASGLTPGTTVYIRFWEFGNDNNGTFSICARSFNCSTVNNSSCANADPFCTGVSYDYCNSTNVPSLGGSGPYGCCLTTPNPAFYYLNVASNGTIIFNISQQTNAGTPIDVDFVLWGPFASQAAMCSGYSASNIVDCSYSTAAVETATIPNAVAGQWYMVLITNFSNQAGVINFSQTNTGQGGAGTTNCNILTAIPGACAGGFYSLTGSVQVPAPPSSGTLTITNSCGGSQVINAPFTSSISYSIPNICGNGQNCTVTAVFSAAGAPTILPATYTAPSCNTLTAVAGACTGGQYVMSGSLTTGCLPTSGTLTITSSCGGSVTINAPFTSPLNWSLPASNGNGGTCTVTAVYSAAGAPIITPVTVNEPQCCGANAGTITVTATNGTVTQSASSTQVVLCQGGSVNLVSNNDYVLPPSFDPGFDDAELFYTIYIPPGPSVPDPDLDPNWTGYYWTGQDFTTANSSGYSSNSSGGCSSLLSLPTSPGHPSPSSATNTLIFVPITADDGDGNILGNGVVNHDQNNDGCFDIGNPISITFLNPISLTSSITCNGSVSIDINGGYPQFLNGIYTIANTGSGSLSSTSATAGGTVTISGLTSGQSYSVSVTDASGCGATTISGIYNGPPIINLSASPTTICVGACTNLSATINSGVTAGNITFRSNQCAPIPDAGIGANNPLPSAGGNWAKTCITVSGVCDQAWNTGDVLSVTLNIAHTYLADLDIYLQAPNGTYYLLSRDNGAGGDNYTNTVFTATAAGAIAGNAPFTGSFTPQGTGGDFSSFNGVTMNGSWCLWVADDAAGDVGSISNWSITLSHQNLPPTYTWTPTAGLSATNTLTPTACPASSTTYTLTATNSCGCTATATIPIIVTQPITPTFNAIGPICSGATPPTLPTSSTNGINGTWSPATVSSSISQTYTFTPTAGQCANTTTLAVTVGTSPTVTGTIIRPTCSNSTNGSISLSSTGGTAPYNYSWSGGLGNNSLLSNLGSGNYSVTVTDARGCTSVSTYAITAPTPVSALFNFSSDPTCNGSANGSASILASGGTMPYSYLWNPTGSTSTSLNNLAAGTYNITVTDSAGCTSTASITLTAPTVITPTATTTNVSCNGGANGSATASASGGTPGTNPSYNYSWTPSGGTAATANNLAAGNYTVTATDSRGCTASYSVTITAPTPITYSSTNTPATCGASNGTASITNVSGGTPNYTYAWSPAGGTGTTAAGLPGGAYTVNITDSRGCTVVANISVGNTNAATASISSFSDVLCHGSATGYATVTATGGQPTYSYAWSPGGATTPTASGLSAGNYSVTVTDAAGCNTITTVTISEPAAVTGSIIPTAVTCSGTATGSATVTPTGGTAGYNYVWNNGGGTAATASNLTAGNYTVTITDINGCTGLVSTTITSPTVVTAVISTFTNLTCNTSNDGTATAIGSGGTSPIAAYSWSPSGGNGPSPTNLAPGTYTVTVTDALGCTATAQASITAPAPVTATIATVPPTCGNANGSATVTAGGGTPNPSYTFSWSPGGTTQAALTNIAAGNYSVIVTDGNGCTDTASTALAPSNPIILSAGLTTDVLCSGDATGSATVSATGTNPITYQWSGGGGTNSTASNLTAGSYSVTATDGAGCTTSLTISVTEPAPVALSANVTAAIICNGQATGAAIASASGGVRPYTYSWSSGGTDSIATGLTAGNYSVTMTDANGCSVTSNTTLTEPAAISFTATAVNALCGTANGSITLAQNTGSGAVGSLTYTWTPNIGNSASVSGLNAGSYSVTITDANGCTQSIATNISNTSPLAATSNVLSNVACNGEATGSASVNVTAGTGPFTYAWSPSGGNGPQANNLTAGSYTVTITDPAGCDLINTIIITEPTLLTASATSTNVLCNGAATGTAQVIPTGGTTSYTYVWTPGGSTSNSPTSLPAGNYNVVVTDAAGCSVTASTIITEPALLAATLTPSPSTCSNANGSINTAITGGNGPYSISWSPGGSTQNNLTGLAAANYTATITDANGCTTNSSTTVSNLPGPTTSATTISNVLCNGGASGSASANILSGNNTPFTYSWTPAGGSSSTATGLTAGNYTVTVTDAQGCTNSSTTTISEPAILAATATNTAVLCYGGATGSATIIASGGSSPYSVLWSPGGATSAQVNNLTAGTYNATVTDNNGCIINASTSISDPNPLTISSTIDNVTCNGGTNGAINASISGGTLPYASYNWSPAVSSGSSASGLPAGNYTVLVTDDNGCTLSSTSTITEPPALSIATSTTDALCGSANGSVTAVISNAQGAVSYLWSPGGATTATVNGLPAGPYTLTAIDAAGCTATAAASVSNVGSPTIFTTLNSNVSCFGGSDGSATVNATPGGSPIATYVWSPSGGSAATATNLPAGTYSITVTDASGCIATDVITITEPIAFSISATSVNVSCNNGSDGSAQATTTTGGNGTITYLWAPGGATGSTASNLSAGNYTVSATDASGCIANTTTTITEPSSLQITTSITAVTCNGLLDGSANASVIGGTGAYIYSWSPAGGNGQTATGLSAGNYAVTVTDASGCVATQNVVINQPTALSLSTTSTPAACGSSNGSATVNLLNGTAASYSWSPAGGTSATANNLNAGSYTVTVTDINGCITSTNVNVSNLNGPVITASLINNVSCNGGNDGAATTSTTATISSYSWSPSGGTAATATNLPAGNYTVTAIDNNGCITTDVITISEPAPMVALATSTDVSCYGGSNGSANVSLTSGGTGALSYLWTPGGATGQQATGLAPGTYDVTVTDALGCIASSSISILGPDEILLSSSATAAACYGGSDGTVTVNILSGGTGGFTYSWSPGGATTATATGLSAGNYTVAVTDQAGCVATQLQTVTEPLAIQIVTTTQPASCGSSNGSANATASGGSSPYTYSWSNGGGNATTTSPLPAGNYTVTVTDLSGCISTATTTINNIGSPTVSLASTTAVSCHGGSDGSATIQVQGGTGPFNYSWSPSGGNGLTANGLSSGNYTVSILDATGCSTFLAVTIQEPTAIALITSTTAASCGTNNGTADVQASGGTGSYLYSWSPVGGNLSTATGLASGNYTVTVTDAAGCTSSTAAIVTSNGGASALIQQVVDVQCSGGSDGSAIISVSGGTAPYSYSWSPLGGTSSNATGLLSGNYTVSITDASGCVTNLIVPILEPLPLSISTTTTPAACNGGTDGTASANVSGGLAPYQYQWSPSGGIGSQAAGLPQGAYTLLVTDANGCAETATAIVNANSNLVGNVTTVPVSCAAGSNGSATISTSGGTPPYSYQWTGTISTSNTANGLTSGTYQVTVTDASGCSYNQIAVIQSPSPLTLSASGALTLCNASSANLASQAAGGTPPYHYYWSTGSTDSVITVAPGNSTVFSVDVTDANGCTTIGQIIPVNVLSPLEVTASGNGIVCAGTIATISALASGGDGVYSYSWNNGTIIGSNAVVTPTQDTYYTVTVTDGCGQPVTDQVFIQVEQIPSVAFTPTSMIGCAPVTVNFNDLSSSTGGSNYSWDFGDQQGSNITDPVHIYTLPGTYSVSLHVTTPNGCADAVVIPNLVQVYAMPIADYTQSSTELTVLEPAITFSNNSSFATSYAWNFGDGSPIDSTENPSHQYTAPGNYDIQLIVTNPAGCTDTIYSTVRIEEGFAIYTPNAFSPNGDGINDSFKPFGIGISNFNMYIIDRWGLQIFHSTSPENPWNGKVGNEGTPCQNDVYEYIIRCNDPSGLAHSYIGHVTLVR